MVQNRCECNSRGNWLAKVEDKGCQCKEGNYVIGATNECKSCGELFSGCQSCQDIGSVTEGQVVLGKTLLKQGQGEYLECRDCGADRYIDLIEKKCNPCDRVIEGCLECDHFGESCVVCRPEYTLVKHPEVAALICIKCDAFILHCVGCDNLNACNKCEQGYTLSNDECKKNL